MVTMPDGYYDRFDQSKNYERHLYRAGRVVQGAELNETQISANDRIKRIADALFKDGAVIRDAGILVNQTTGVTTLQAGVLYARGAMRGVAPRTVTIAITGTVSIGIFLQDSVVTELEDATLIDPAIGLRNTSEPGAARLKVVAVWGVAGDGTTGDFYPVYTVVDGNVMSVEPPPQIDGVSLAIASYDRDSTGGYYVVSGLDLTKLDDDSGNQVYSLAAGNARVNGKQVLLQHARRVVYPATPDLKQVLLEQKTASGGTERVNVNHSPISTVDQVSIYTDKTVTVTRGPFSGGSDILPDSAIVSILAVAVGGTWNGTIFNGASTTYTVGTDYTLSSDSVNWAPAGAEPSPGSTYQVRYRYIAQVTPTALDDTGFTVTGAVAGQPIMVSYRWKRPRIDRLCIDMDGSTIWVAGTPNDVSPRIPAVPAGLLSLSNVTQTWTTARSVKNERVQVQSMDQLQSLETKVDNLFAVVSEQQLKTAAALSDPTTKRGIFVDNFNDDNMRDQGVSQNAAVTDGALTLPAINVTVMTAALAGTQTLPQNTAGTAPVIQQTLRTGCLSVNPYMAFDPIPASCKLEPATDFWTATQTVWLSPTTKRFTTRREVIDRVTSLGWLTRQIGTSTEVLVTSQTELVRTTTSDAEYLRQIVIAFQLNGFGPNELLNTVKFDGISVSFTS